MNDAEVADLRRRLSALPPADPAVHAFAHYRPAGVLVPVVRDEAGPQLLFTVRSHELPHHAGQISFPGGGCEPGEEPLEAARREAYEEVGLDVPADAIVGRLSALPSPARYLATPFVAVVDRPSELRLDSREVAAVFSAPIADLLAFEPDHEVRQLDGIERTLFRYHWQQHVIWGFTGSVLHELLGSLRDAGSTV